MNKDTFNYKLRSAVERDIKKHIEECLALGSNDKLFVFTETLTMLRLHFNQREDSEIEEAIDKRESALKESPSTSPENYYLNLELMALRKLKGEILHRFPNSFQIKP